jgi:hypothetical protein
MNRPAAAVTTTTMANANHSGAPIEVASQPTPMARTTTTSAVTMRIASARFWSDVMGRRGTAHLLSGSGYRVVADTVPAASGRSQISGDFTVAEASASVATLQTGRSLPYAVSVSLNE